MATINTSMTRYSRNYTWNSKKMSFPDEEYDSDVSEDSDVGFYNYKCVISVLICLLIYHLQFIIGHIICLQSASLFIFCYISPCMHVFKMQN